MATFIFVGAFLLSSFVFVGLGVSEAHAQEFPPITDPTITICHDPLGLFDGPQTMEIPEVFWGLHAAHPWVSIPGSADYKDECGSVSPSTGTLTVTKVVINDDGGESEVSDFSLFVDEDGVTSGEENEFEPGNYTLSESGPDGHDATFSGDCGSGGSITIVEDEEYFCTITNDDVSDGDGGGGSDVTTAIVVKKATDSPGSEEFEFQPSWGDNFFLGNGAEQWRTVSRFIFCRGNKS